MSNKRNPIINSSQPIIYHIRLKGHLSRQWTEWFAGLTITLEEDGNTLLTGTVIDQAALHGLLKKVRDLGMPLLLVNRVSPIQADAPIVKPMTRGKIMKWFHRVFIVIVILVCGLVGYTLLTALHTEHLIGFQIIQTTNADGHSFIVGVWYPTQTQPWPTTLSRVGLMDVARNAPASGSDLTLVEVLYGNGGGSAGNVDLAFALANASYIVAAPMHNGDNNTDQSAVGIVISFLRQTFER